MLYFWRVIQDIGDKDSIKKNIKKGSIVRVANTTDESALLRTSETGYESTSFDTNITNSTQNVNVTMNEHVTMNEDSVNLL